MLWISRILSVIKTIFMTKTQLTTIWASLALYYTAILHNCKHDNHIQEADISTMELTKLHNYVNFTILLNSKRSANVKFPPNKCSVFFLCRFYNITHNPILILIVRCGHLWQFLNLAFFFMMVTIWRVLVTNSY